MRILRFAIAFVIPLFLVSFITYPFGLEREVYKWEADLTKKLTSNGSIEQTGLVRETQKRKYALLAPNSSGASWVINRRSTDEELQKLFSQFLAANKVIMSVPVDFFSHMICFENTTYYRIPDTIFGNYFPTRIPHFADHLKFEITLPSSKELLQPNKIICVDPDVTFYIAEITTDLEQTKKDIKEMGNNDVLASVIQLRMFERPKYSYMPLIVIIVIYWSWFHILLLIRKVWKEFVK